MTEDITYQDFLKMNYNDRLLLHEVNPALFEEYTDIWLHSDRTEETKESSYNT